MKEEGLVPILKQLEQVAKMKNKFYALIFICLIPFSGNAQVPVTDGASIATDMLNQAQTIAKWQQQCQQMVVQLQTMEDELNALTGSRGLGNILNDPKFREYLPSDWQSVYDDIQKGGYEGLSGDAKTTFNDMKIHDRCSSGSNDEARKVCEAVLVKSAQDLTFQKNVYQRASERLDTLSDRIRATDL